MGRFQTLVIVSVLSGTLALGAIGVGGAGASVATKYPTRACGELEAAASTPRSGDVPDVGGLPANDVNQLWGDWFIVQDGRAFGDNLVAIEAAESVGTEIAKSKELGSKLIGKGFVDEVQQFRKTLRGLDKSTTDRTLDNASEAALDAAAAAQAALDWCRASAPVILALNDACAELRGNVYSFALDADERNTPADGINVYSFALYPELHQPSGTTNLSRIDGSIMESGGPGANAVGKSLAQALQRFERFANRVRFAGDSAKVEARNLAKAESALSDVQDTVQETLQWCDEIVPAETTPDPQSTTNNQPKSSPPAQAPQPHTTTTTHPTTTTTDPYCYEDPPGSGYIICA